MIVNAGDDQALLQEAGLPLFVSEAQIAVHWREEEYYHPPPRFIGHANASDPSLFERFSEEHFPECFKEAGKSSDDELPRTSCHRKRREILGSCHVQVFVPPQTSQGERESGTRLTPHASAKA